MRVINSIAPELAADIRAAISGRPRLKAAKAKRAEPVKCYVSQFHKFDPQTDRHTVQLPIAFRTAEYNADHTPYALKAKWASEKKAAVWVALSAYFPNMRGGVYTFSRIKPHELHFCAPSYVKFIPDDERAVRAFCFGARAMRERARVRHIEFVRIGQRKLDDDNIIAAFKAIRDATCSFLVRGASAANHQLGIGHADDKLKKRGVTWTYRQQKCEANPRLYGIRIILHCAPRTTE
ncbi:MAG TPA: hypothetical protein VNG33_02435 [Polyangiaceae bacterium]|nr:hypothetical protein [Polyangiaceae bacterium]